MYFVDEEYDYEELLKLIHVNQSIWGGRYNPIVPVQKNKISTEYQQLIKHYDPDYIFYSKGVDPKTIRELRLFNPAGYYCLDDKPRKEDISGVSSIYFISSFDPNTKIILVGDLWRSRSQLLSFYETNFGLSKNGYRFEFELAKHYPQTIIDSKNVGELNKIIHHDKPINQASLSKKNLNTRIVRNLEEASYDSVEIVVSKDKSSNQDLLYFWNRHLFECSNILYVTLDELEELCNDKFFGGVLYDQSTKNTIEIISFSLTEDELKSLIETKFKPIAFNTRFIHKPIESFPFEVLDANGLFERNYGESTSTQTLVSDEGLIQLPKLSFTDKIGFFPQKWALDVIIKKGSTNHLAYKQFPLTTQTHNIIKGVVGRVNLRRNISVFIHDQTNIESTLEIIVPKFPDLIRQLIQRPVIHGEPRNSKFLTVGSHDDSNRLAAFIKTFNSRFDTIDDFFTDKFWVDLIEDLCVTKSPAGPTITFKKLVSRCEEILKENGVTLGEREKTFQNIENLEIGLKITLSELCNYKVFLKGFTIKCTNCSSHFWYPLTEIDHAINCKGCLESFDFPVEPEFSYRLNDLIKNNIFQSPTQRDGNLAVIRSLVSIRIRSHSSFEYNPQLNLYSDYNSNKPCSEIDLLALSDGNFIIGEVKHNSKGFSEDKNKALEGLVEIAKEIYPDKIILACYEDSNDKLEKAKTGLIHLFRKWEYQPEIETLQLFIPDYFPIEGYRYFYY
ncbi:MAG: hypothetical protein ACMVP2_06960 [Imperialibacter sp.]|uniref:hypothetical protein n=1 Tax=Imperialibacter sp. TaxID=2038411 RepID=UPI003A8A0DB5